ncbi:MAG: hypothetical protein HY536_00925 [Candidatus Colwellbacteria bacterium]|nr:hypothetical protein [Candidatus Colwellbacteria bacterium]
MLHPIQQKLLRAAETARLGMMSLREIGRLIDEPSAQKVKHHLAQLARGGFIVIDRMHGIIRLVRLGEELGRRDGLVAIPIVGSANCGQAEVFAEEDVVGYLRISRGFLPKVQGVFAVKAVGSSMNRANINGKNVEDGDFVLVDGDGEAPRSGEYVLSIIDGCANMKRYFEDAAHNQIILCSESTLDFSPIFIRFAEAPDYVVNGTILDVIKKPRRTIRDEEETLLPLERVVPSRDRRAPRRSPKAARTGTTKRTRARGMVH